MAIDPHIEAHDLLRQLVHKHLKMAGHILEIGAGSGFLLRELSDEYQALGCATDPFTSDRSEDKVCFRSLGAEEIHLLNRRFELAYSVHSFHHFENIKHFLQGLEKTLSWDGLFVLVDWKKGAQTGVPEYYYPLDYVVGAIQEYNFIIRDQGETEENFYVVAFLHNRLLAVATDEQGEDIYSKMFGQAPYFDLYRFNETGFHFIEKRKNIYQKTLQHEKTLDVYAEVPECQALLSKVIGKNGRRRLAEMGVKMFFEQGRVRDALEKILNTVKINGSK